MKQPSTIHLLSGGLDSVTMLYDLVQKGASVHCLSFDYRQRHKQELLFARHHAMRCGCQFTTMDLPPLGGLTEQSWIVPNRNAVFLSVAVNLACQMECDTVTIGCNQDDYDAFPDCRCAFLNAMNVAIESAGYSVTIRAPFLGKRKWEIAAMAQEFGIRSDSIWTCYNGGDQPCGECPACQKLNAAKLP